MNEQSLLSHLQHLGSILFSAWHFHYLHVLVAIAVMLPVIIPRLPARNNVFRNTVRALAGIAVLLMISGFGQLFGLQKLAAVMDEVSQLLSGMLVIHIVGLLVFRVIFPRFSLEPPRILEDLLLVLVYVAWIMVRLRYAGLDLSSLVTTSAVMTAIIAFSMQETLSNILGGLAVQLDKSISIGDWIKVDDVSGRVVQVSWRHTAVRTRNGEMVILPNSLLMKSKFMIVGNNEVYQWRRWINFYISDTKSPRKVLKCINESLVDANIPNVSRSPQPQCLVMDFKPGMTHYSVRYWLIDPNLDDPTDSEVRLHIYATLQRHGYNLMHPVLDVSLTENNIERDQYLRAQEVALREKTLRKIEMFRQLSDDEIRHIANTLIFAPFARGSVITHQGAVAHWLYVLITGEVDVWFEVPGGERQHLATMEEGAIFGERGMMTGEPRRATVTARTDVECYRIDKDSFEFILQARPELAEDFARVLADRSQAHVQVETKTRASPEGHALQLLASIRNFFHLEAGS